MNDLVFLSAYQLAQMIRDRTVSSVELLDAYLAQIARHNPRLNAICTLDEDKARSRARQADEALAKGENWGPLHGIPMTIKDIFETEGLLTTAGFKPLKDYIPQQDATVVTRLKTAGAIVMGKSNLSELASDYQSTNPQAPPLTSTAGACPTSLPPVPTRFRLPLPAIPSLSFPWAKPRMDCPLACKWSANAGKRWNCSRSRNSAIASSAHSKGHQAIDPQATSLCTSSPVAANRWS